MTQDVNVFADAGKQPETTNVISNATDHQHTADNAQDPITTFVGEGKKFRDTSQFVQGYSEAQSFIEQLKAENAQMREEIAKSLTREQLAETINQQNKQTVSQKQDTPATLTPEDIAKIVRETVTNNEKEQTANANVLKAQEELIKIYGNAENATKALRDKANELNLGTDYLGNIAAQSPTALIKLVAGTANSQANGTQRTVTQSTVNTAAESFNPNTNTKEANRAYYSKMLKEDKAKYFNPKTQQEIMKLASEGKY